MTRRYTPEQEAEVAALRATGLLQEQIAERTGIPRRSVANILARTPVAEVVSRETAERVAERLWSVVSAASDEALRRIADPRTKAGELALLLRIAAEQHALLTGGPTARTETVERTVFESPALTADEQAALRAWADTLLGLSDAELAAWLATEGAPVFRAEGEAREQLVARIEGRQGGPTDVG